MKSTMASFVTSGVPQFGQGAPPWVKLCCIETHKRFGPMSRVRSLFYKNNNGNRLHVTKRLQVTMGSKKKRQPEVENYEIMNGKYQCVRIVERLMSKGGMTLERASPHIEELNMQPRITVEPGMKARCLHIDPQVFFIENFVSGKHCDEIMALHEAREPAPSLTFGGQYTGALRTSTTWHLYYKEVSELLEKACTLLKCKLEQFEEPQIVRYIDGQSFGWHYDAVPPKLLDNGGQRIATVLVYLNDVGSSEGGATCFKDIKLAVNPKKGSALVFFPAHPDGTNDDRTLHAGQPCLGEKWVFQLWLHEKAYTPHVPPGNSHDGVFTSTAADAS